MISFCHNYLFLLIIIVNINLFLWGEPISDFSKCGISDFEPELDNVPTKEDIGTNHVYKGKVVDDAKALPWMVTLLFGEAILCTGSIIGHNYILTAFHCIENKLALKDFIRISYGTVNSSNQTHMATVKSIHPHPNASASEFNAHIYGREFELGVYLNDLAIIKVENPIEFSENVRPICLTDNGPPKPKNSKNKNEIPTTDFPVIVAGWGQTQPMCRIPLQKASEQLMVGKMRIVSAEECRGIGKDFEKKANKSLNSAPFWNNTLSLLEEYSTQIVTHLFCVVSEPSMVEKGDSGGPLMSKIGKNNWVQMGVASMQIGCDSKNFKSTDRVTAHYAKIDCAFVENETNGEVKCAELL